MNGFELILPFLRPIEHLILDPDISEIMVNGPTSIFIERAGRLLAVPDVTLTQASLLVAVKNIARRLGDDISEAKPILDSRLPDGSRVAAVLPPCSIHGVALTIRKFNSHKFKMKDLIEKENADARTCCPIGELRHRAQEHPHLWGNVEWKDDSSECVDRIHPGPRAHCPDRGHSRNTNSERERPAI